MAEDSFRVDLRLFSELGERLISRDEIAIVELVKNAYDADAKIVEVVINEGRSIEVRDDGTGMNREEIEMGWLTLGTGIKRKNKWTHSGRRVLGEKGLGRLAVLRLGEKVTIFTKKNESPCYRLIMDWSEAKKNLIEVYTPVDKMKVVTDEIKENEKFLLTSIQGTTINIENLLSEWNGKKVEKLRHFLGRLVEPEISNSPCFTIYLVIDGKRNEILPPETITKNYNYYLKAEVDDKGNYKGNLQINIESERTQEEFQGKIIPWELENGEEKYWKDVKDGGIGPFRFTLRVWDLDVLEKGLKRDLKDWTGISLVRNSFRVVQPDIDWIGLNLRRVQNPTMRLSTNQLIGSVFILSDTNPHIVDKTDREGVVENDAVLILKESVNQLMNILEQKRRKIRKGKTLTKGAIFHYLDTTPVKQIAQTLPPIQKKGLEEIISNIDAFKDLLEEWILGRDRMATMGMLGGRLIHEARNALMKINDNYPLLEKYIDDLDSPAKVHIIRMVEGGRVLSKIFNELDPFLKFSRIRKEKVYPRHVVESLEFLFGPEIRKQRIKIVNNISSDINFKAGSTDIYVVLANILDNSVYWLAKESKRETKVIEFRGTEIDNKLILEIADSGPGINPDIKDIIFEAGFTTKLNGTGLGLAIVKDIIDFYGGKIVALDDKALGGALLHIELPYEKG